MYPRSMEDSDLIVIQGSNMAECHPVAFRWVAKAKLGGAKLIHVDPRFTRTSAMADIHAAIRAGSDVAFLGGLVNYVINSERWNSEPFFREYVVNYTNAATIVSDDFKGAEEMDGVFSGLLEPGGGAKEWPYNAGLGRYDNKTWQYAAGDSRGQVPAGSTPPMAPSPGPPAGAATPPKPAATGGTPAAAAPPRYDALVRGMLKPPPPRDETLQNPRCVFQIVKQHFARYTPEMVEKVTGCPRDVFIKVAETILANSGPDKTTSFAYAVAWTQHTNGVQTIGTCAMLQLLLGNMGPPGTRVDPGVDRPAHALPFHPRLHAAPLSAGQARHAGGLAQDRHAAAELLGQHAEVHGVVPQVDVRCRGDAGERLRLRVAPPHPRRSLAHGDVRGDGRRARQGHVLHRPEPRHLAPCQ